MSRARLAVICDYVEENWPSMDLVGEMLLKHLQRDHSDSLTATRLCPPMRRRFTHVRTTSKHLFNADRLVNRFWDYQRWMQRRKREFDLFHVIDHSYGQLVHGLPSARTIVTCHDLDTFKCLLEPVRDHRSKLFKAMIKHTLSGFRKAALVTCDSVATRNELLAHELLPPERTVVVPNGVHPACSPESNSSADAEVGRLIDRPVMHAIDILHVGSTILRKRIDVLLRIFAALRKEFPRARLIRVGGPFTTAQLELLEQLKLNGSVVVLPYLERDVLAAIYRRATLVLQPSEREGFGLPVIEAMACGTPVVASDLPVLREIGGDEATYCPVADVPAWTESVIKLLCERQDQPDQWSRRRAAGLAQAAKFSWAEYARKMVALYQELL